jgi:hypothetical protein
LLEAFGSVQAGRGAGGLVTVTVASLDAVPLLFVQLKEYVSLAVGETDSDPPDADFDPLQPPEAVHETAFETVHKSFADPPDTIEAGTSRSHP